MPTTIDAAFNSLLADLRTKRPETAAAATHRQEIYRKLQNDFGATSIFQSGSFGAGTSISKYSDADYFVVIPAARLKADSNETLADIAAALRSRFSTTPNIRVNSPGVQLPFGLDGAEATEVIPARAIEPTKLGHAAYEIADGRGGWIFTSPGSHGAYVNEIDKKHSGKVKSLIRFVKAWKYMRDVPLKSFYLEIRVAEYCSRQDIVLYDADLALVLREMFSSNLASFVDPRFADKVLVPCNTEVQRQEAMQKLSRAQEWAMQAWELKRAEKINAAFERWGLVFNGNFPLYG